MPGGKKREYTMLRRAEPTVGRAVTGGAATRQRGAARIAPAAPTTHCL
eukprot:gene30068-59097_t